MRVVFLLSLLCSLGFAVEETIVGKWQTPCLPHEDEDFIISKTEETDFSPLENGSKPYRSVTYFYMGNDCAPDKFLWAFIVTGNYDVTDADPSPNKEGILRHGYQFNVAKKASTHYYLRHKEPSNPKASGMQLVDCPLKDAVVKILVGKKVKCLKKAVPASRPPFVMAVTAENFDNFTYQARGNEFELTRVPEK